MLTEFPPGRIIEESVVISVVDYGVFVRLRDGVVVTDAPLRPHDETGTPIGSREVRAE